MLERMRMLPAGQHNAFAALPPVNHERVLECRRALYGCRACHRQELQPVRCRQLQRRRAIPINTPACRQLIALELCMQHVAPTPDHRTRPCERRFRVVPHDEQLRFDLCDALRW